MISHTQHNATTKPFKMRKSFFFFALFSARNQSPNIQQMYLCSNTNYWNFYRIQEFIRLVKVFISRVAATISQIMTLQKHKSSGALYEVLLVPHNFLAVINGILHSPLFTYWFTYVHIYIFFPSSNHHNFR